MFKRLANRQFGLLPRSSRSRLLIGRGYRLNQQQEKDKYDQLMRQVINGKNGYSGYNGNGYKGNNNQIHVSSTTFTKKRMPFKTMVLLVVGTGSLTMVVYVIYQYMNFDNQGSNHIFLPLWFHTNIFGKNRYQFPSGIKYFDDDDEYYHYLDCEISQFNRNKSDTNLENYLNALQSDNIKYKVLETLSSNGHIKQIFGLPLTIASPTDFQIWIENKYPTISGVTISNNKLSWSIKSIRISEMINDLLVSLGLKLNRLDSEQIKIHEKSSGKIHEVPIEDKNMILNKNKDYQIKFQGYFIIKDKNDYQQGIIQYSGLVDFDHLMINRGIKISSMNLIMNLKNNNQEKINYKIL